MFLSSKYILIKRIVSARDRSMIVSMVSKTCRQKSCGISPSWCRYFSNYDFPTRTEEPIVTHTLASEVSSSYKNFDDNHLSCTSLNKNARSLVDYSVSVKDVKKKSWFKNIICNTNSLNSTDANTNRDNHIHINLQHPKDSRFLSSSLTQPISSMIPKIVPPNLPRDVLTEPITHVSTLSNGIRVSSQETYGQVCTLGLLSSCGSRYESREKKTTGVNHLMEIMSFRGTMNLSYTEFSEKMDNLGGGTFASSSREHFLYCADVLRPNASEAMFLLGEAILNPRLDDIEVEESKKVIEWQWMDMIPETKLGEGLQIAGFGPVKKEKTTHQQLGMPHFCPLESLPNITSHIVRTFREEHLLNPEKMVIAGAGIEHDKLVNLAEDVFGHIGRRNAILSDEKKAFINETVSTGMSEIVSSIYTGGEHYVSTSSADGFMRIGLAFPTGGWFSSDLVPACVLQTLLGGGSSFSAGGPGKGMYSRLYREVLNRYYWVESAEAFTSMHTEAGLIGITGSSIPSKSRDLLRVFAEHFMRLISEDDISFEELNRARNMLKCNILTQLESRLVLFEDLGRQVLTYGMRERTQDMCRKIEEVTKEDIVRLVRKAILGNKSSRKTNGLKSQRILPTVCAVGQDINSVPSEEEVASWFKVIL